MHGGLSPQLTSIDQLRNLPRPQDPPNPSMGIDLLWADPDQWVKVRCTSETYACPFFYYKISGLASKHTRSFLCIRAGCGHRYVPEVKHRPDCESSSGMALGNLQTNLLRMKIKALQVVQDGYEFFASKKMVTIFSAPHYCGQFDNFAATMKAIQKLPTFITLLIYPRSGQRRSGLQLCHV